MPYLTKEELKAIFANQPLVSGGPFWSRVAEDVEWTVMGQSPASGRYTDLAELRANTLEKLGKALAGPPELKIANVFFGGENNEWTSMELEARGVRKNGKEYINHYALVIKWNEEGKVVLVRDYLDTALIEEVWKESKEMNLF